jgi:hypothetical protein
MIALPWLALADSATQSPASCEPGAQSAGIGDHAVRLALLHHDAPWEIARARMRLEGRLPRIGPAIVLE